MSRLSLLVDLASLLAREVDFDQLLGTACERLARNLRADRASIWLVDAERGDLVTRVAVLPELPALRQPVERGIAGFVARTGEVVRVGDAASDPRFSGGDLGYRRLAPRKDAVSLADGAEVFDAKRIAAGVPDLARDAQPEEVFAGEALLEELNGVDFQKGCFVGQENVSRMKRRATTRRKFCPIVFDGAAFAYGTPIKAGEAEIGAVRTGMGGRAIALVRLDRAIEASKNGAPLSADGREIRLDPPAWLILPSREEA